MEVENKLKAMGLELPAAGAPPPGRAGAVKIGNILFVGGHTPGPAYRGKLGAGLTVSRVRRGTAGLPQLFSRREGRHRRLG